MRAPSKVTLPISTSTSFPPGWTRERTTPPAVWMVKGSEPTSSWSKRKREKMRRPLPLFSASLPSGLKMRSRKSAP